MYVNTWGIGRFVLQSASIVSEDPVFHVGQNAKWNSFSIPIWPMLSGPLIAVWPPPNHLSHDTLNEFCDRRDFAFGTVEFI